MSVKLRYVAGGPRIRLRAVPGIQGIQGIPGQVQDIEAGQGIAVDLSDPVHPKISVDAVAAEIPFTPTGQVGSTDVQAAIAELDSKKLSVLDAASNYQPLDADLTAIAALSTQPFGRDLLTMSTAEATLDRLRDFKTVALLLADTDLTYSAGVNQVSAGDRVTAQGFRYEVAAADATDHHVENAGGVKLYVLPLGERMYLTAFGLVGGDTDETALLQKAFAASAGYELRAGKGLTYRATESLQLRSGTELNLRGSTINFACVGQKRNLEVYGNDVVVRNGRVRNVVGSEGYEGSFQTPIVIGRYQELAGFRSVVVEDMTVETVLPGGNGIAVFGDSENIDIRRIRFPNSSYIGIPIMLHWSFNAAEVNGGGEKKTTHQKNIRINNIWCGVLSRIPDQSLEFDSSVVFLSAVYSAEISNILVENFSRGKAVTVYAGDWGFQYAQKTNEVALGSRSISVRNIWGRCFSGIEVYMKNPLDEPLVPWPSQVSFDNVNLLGYGSVVNRSKGVKVAAAEDVTITNSLFDGFYHGVNPTVDVKNFRLLNSVIRNSRSHGLLVGGNGEGCRDWSLRGNLFEGNNAASGATTADLMAYGVAGIGIEDNIFDSPLATWNVRLDGGATAVSRARVVGNRSRNVLSSAGPCFSFGSSVDTTIVDAFRDNVADALPTNGLKAGQIIIGMLTSIAAAPQYIGQEAYVNGQIYRATGYGSASDWKRITLKNPPDPIASIAATPSYTGQIAISGGNAYMAVGVSSSSDWKQIS